MNKLVVVLLIALLGLASAGYTPNIQFDSWNFKSSKLDEQWWAYRPTVYGGSGNYWYTWSNLPTGWQYYSNSFNTYNGYKDYVFWPNNIQYGRYQCAVTVYDIVYKVEVKKYVVFDFNGYSDKFNVFLRDSYDQYYSYNTYNFEVKDIIEFPAWSKVEMLISDGDVGAIREIIDRVLESDNDCDDKKDFLDGVLTRIDNFIKTSQTTIVGIEKQIAANEATIAWKNKALNDLIKELKYNGLSDLKKKLNDLLAKVAWYEKRITDNKKKVSDNNAAIKQFEEKIWKIQDVEVVALEGQIKNLKSHAADLVQKIKWRKGDVLWWEYELKDVHLMLGKKQKILEDAWKDIKDFKQKIQWYQKKNDDLQALIYSDENDLRALRTQVASVRAEIDATRDFSEINQDIEDIKMEIEDLKAKNSALQANIKRIEWAISQIKDAQSQFSWTIKKKLPYCKFQDDTVEIVDEYTGHWTYDRFDRYLSSVWGTYPRRLVSSSKSSYHVQNVNLYSTQWYSDYWGDYAYDYNDSFTCTGLYSRPAYYGRISKIGSNSVWATDDNNDEWELNFSSCSVFQSATGNSYPRKGDWVLWNGSRKNSSAKKYQIRNAICV